MTLGNMEHLIDIPGRLHSVAVEKHIAGTDLIYDDFLKTTLDILNLENITDVKVQDGKLQFLNIQELILKEISIETETQKQSDWNLTNSTQVDFIKNKPTVYNKLEVDDKLIAKQDIINDLVTIRSGAQAGATAYQKPQTGIPATDLSSDVQSDLAAIGDIKAVIPEQASSSNKLADKDFVNSSIATATATYRGSYNLVSDLSLTVSATQQQIADALATKMAALSITPDNNDYCFVQIPTADATPTEIARIDRYKYDGTAWAYEYSLNNSSFTAAQWAALNSGITSGLVAKLSALPTNSELTTSLNGKVDKETGKGLSTNDYTDSDKEKVSSITLPGKTYVIYRNQWILDGNIATNSEGVLKIEATAFLTPAIVDGRLVLTRNRPKETPYFKIYSPFEGTLRISCYQWDEDEENNWRLELGNLSDYPERYYWLEPFYHSSDNTDIAIYVKAGWNTIRGATNNVPLTIIGISLQRGILALNSVVTQRNMGLMSPGYLTQLFNKVDKVTGKGLSANDYTTADKEKLNNLPTATELTQELAGKANTADLATVGTTGSYNDLSDKPDLSSFITRSVDDLMNYYLKSETYTKTEVQQLIGAIQQFHYEIYPTLPQTGASNVLYLIGPTGTGTDKYEEYVYANNDWVKIGDTSIDLSGYVTTQALNTALADYVTSSALSTALAGKENTANKKTTIAGNEGDDTYYPSTKAVAVYVEEAKKQMLRELYLSTDPRPDSDVNRLRYNDTGADIIRTAEWGERVIHKAGHYWLNGLGDITEDEMSKIYSNGGIINPRPDDTTGNYLTTGKYQFRTNLNIAQMHSQSAIQYQFTAQYNTRILVINLGNNNPQYVNGFRQFGSRQSVCKAIIPALEMSGITKTDSANNSFYGARVGQDFMYAMFTKIVIDCPLFKYTPLIMYKCLKYLVDNAGNTSAITVTVHATTYGYLTDSSALPAEHSGVVETPADIATVTNEELVGMKEWDETTKKYVYATKAEWQQIVTDATAKNISFASA